ncbi:MAG TPA: hypothetical protein PLM56_05645 [Cyclobacteriaceae bacterium]|nr:hypothetical protein [Cyclobacteriaceae bacterium]HRF32958.1 hypothetical protein [Cyclobacteriaceae bacterium]
MKYLLIVITGLLLSISAEAQTFNEWFRQKKTQRRYLTKQIVLLRTYLGYLKKGYEIADKGLTTIHNIKNGDFNLHRDFFGSLKNVNPHIANSAKVADIIAFQVYVIRDIRNVNNFCKNNEHFTPEEIRYVAAVYSNVLFLTDASISELLMIIRSNQTEMKDDERLMRIDRLYDDMLDKHAFVQSFDNDVRLMAAEREREQREVETLRKQFDTI